MWNEDPAGLLITPVLPSSGLNDVVRAQANTPISMVKVTQAQYNALTPVSTTLYLIVG